MKLLKPFLLSLLFLQSLHGEEAVMTLPKMIQEGIAAGFYTKEVDEDAGPGGLVWLDIFRDTQGGARPSNFEMQVLDTSGKEIARRRGDDKDQPVRENTGKWNSKIWVPLQAPWKDKLVVKVRERGRAAIITYTLQRMSAEQAKKLSEKIAREEAGLPAEDDPNAAPPEDPFAPSKRKKTK